MSRLSFARKELLRRAAESLYVTYDDLCILSPDDVLERIGGGDITVADLSYVTGLEEKDIITETVKLSEKGFSLA
ncbi:hypothetical protein [Pantoea ananatis]|uniref:hypothetical protein n=1 Tax=Pantoea ananas TaxID=553 RepID=UPI0023AF5E42|nr:hypothetical protein [Pantoea ananatis]